MPKSRTQSTHPGHRVGETSPVNLSEKQFDVNSKRIGWPAIPFTFCAIMNDIGHELFQTKEFSFDASRPILEYALNT